MVSLIYFGLSRIRVIVETENKLFLFLLLPFALYFPSEWLESQERGNSQFTTLLLQTEGTVFLNPSLNRKIQRRKYVECENLCWRCEDLIHLKHFSLKQLQKEMLGMDRLHGRQGGNHTFLLAAGERQWITFFEKRSLFSERKKKAHTDRNLPQRLQFPINQLRFYCSVCGRGVPNSQRSNGSVIHVLVPLSL